MLSKKYKGLTYIEVMAVIIILSILLTATVVYMVNVQEDGELAAAQQEAKVMTDLVSEYIQVHGTAPTVIENADYIQKPALLSLEKIGKNMTDNLKGNFYIYGINNEVFYDYPEKYIGEVYYRYVNDNAETPIIEGTNFIDVQKLYKDGYLDYAPQTSYSLLDDGTIKQITLQQEIEATEDSYINKGKNKPTKPLIIPNKTAPYYANSSITFTAQSYYQKGDIRYEWEGVHADGLYNEGDYVIKVTAYDANDRSIKSETSKFYLSIKPENKPPSQPNFKIKLDGSTVPTSKLTNTLGSTQAEDKIKSKQVINIMASSSDPDGDAVEYTWLGRSGNGKYERGVNKVSVYATDTQGNVSEKSTIKFEISNSEPEIISVKNSRSPIYLDTPVEFEPVIEDEDGDFTEWDITNVKVTPVDPAVTYKDNGELSRNNIYPIGVHKIYFEVKDTFGASSTYEHTFNVINRMPTEPPTLKMSPNTNIRPDTDITWTVSGSTDADEHNISYEWYNKKRNYGFGIHTVKVRAVDHLGGKSDWVTKTFSVVNSPPTRPNVSMSPTSNIRPDTPLSFFANGSSDPQGDSFHYEFKADNGSWSRTKPNRTYSFGNHTIYVRAVDEWGAISSTNSISFSITNSSPSEPNLSMSPNSNLRPDTYIRFNVSGVSDPQGDSFHYEYRVGNGSWSKSKPNGTYNFGTHRIYARAVDEWGDISNVTSISFSITNSAPTKPNISMSPTSSLSSNTSISFSASGSSDPQGDSFNYQWKVNSGSWKSSKPNGQFSLGSHTVYVRAVDEWGAISSVDSVSFRVTNTRPTRPSFSITSTLNTITGLNPVITTASTDIDGQSIRYYWRLDYGSWTTTRPTHRLSSGYHTLQLRARDSVGAYSYTYTKSFRIDSTTLTKYIYLSESTDRSRSGSYSVPYGSDFTINSVTSNNSGSTSHSKSGSRIYYNVWGGSWVDREAYYDWNKYSDYVTDYRTRSNTNFPGSISYSNNGYSGTIYDSGSPWVISGSPSDSRRVTTYRDGSSRYSSSYPYRIYYSSGGYTGYRYRDGSPRHISGSYTSSDSTTRRGYRSSNSCPYLSGYNRTSCSTWGTHIVRSGDTYGELAIKYYGRDDIWGVAASLEDYNNEDARYLSIGTRLLLPNRVSGEYLDDWDVDDFKYYARYYRPARDTRRYRQYYEGTAYRPDTRTWKQRYRGTVYKGGTSYRNYEYQYRIKIIYTVH